MRRGEDRPALEFFSGYIFNTMTEATVIAITVIKVHAKCSMGIMESIRRKG
jgi:hypothetical protein